MKRSASAAPDHATTPDFFSGQVTEARRFHLNLNPPATTGLAVVCGGFEHCTSSYLIRRTSFPFYALEYVAGGSGTVKFGRKEQPLRSGSMFSYGPGVAYEMATDPRRPMSKYFVDFSGTQAARVLRNCKLSPGSVFQVFPPLEIQPLFEELIRLGLRRKPQTHVVCARLVEAMLLTAAGSRLADAAKEGLAFATFQRCRDHMQRNFLRLRTMGELAAECRVDDAYICRLFQRYDHQTPSRLLLQLKMNHAAERLRSPAVLAKQVAEEIGFANQFHFSRSFKSVFGVSPRAVTKMR